MVTSTVGGYDVDVAALPPSVRQADAPSVHLDRRGARERRCGTPTATSTSTRWRACGTARSVTAGAEIADAVAEPARHPRGLLVLRAVHQRSRPTSSPRSCVTLDADPRRPGLLLRVRLGSGRHGDEAGPAHPRHGRAARAHAHHQPRARLPRHQLRRHERAGHRAQPGGLGPARRPMSCRSRATTSRRSSVLMAERGDEVAAVLAEPVQGAGGVFPPTEGYLADLRRLCDRHGALLIFDEVITGFGRLGTWFAAHHYGVTPDLTTFAKAITSGLPAPRRRVRRRRRAGRRSSRTPAYLLRHGYTYSGHPSACAAGVGEPRRSSSARTCRRAPSGSAPASATGSRRWPPTA